MASLLSFNISILKLHVKFTGNRKKGFNYFGLDNFLMRTSRFFQAMFLANTFWHLYITCDYFFCGEAWKGECLWREIIIKPSEDQSALCRAEDHKREFRYCSWKYKKMYFKYTPTCHFSHQPDITLPENQG